MKFALLSLLLFPTLSFAATGYVECDYFRRQPETHGPYENVEAATGLKSTTLQEEIEGQLKLGLSGNFEIKHKAITISGLVTEGKFEELSLIDTKSGYQASAMPYSDISTVRLISKKDLKEIQCSVKIK